MGMKNVYHHLCSTLVLASSLLVASCSNYQLGEDPANALGSVAVVPAENRSLAPQAGTLVTQAVREKLLSSRSVQLRNLGESSNELKIIVTEFDRSVAATETNDTQRARAYRITLTAQATLTSMPDGRVYFQDRIFTASDQIFVDSGVIQAEHQAMPLIARELGRKIADAVEGTW